MPVGNLMGAVLGLEQSRGPGDLVRVVESSQVISGSAARGSNVARSSRSSARTSCTAPLTRSDTGQSASAALQALCGVQIRFEVDGGPSG